MDDRVSLLANRVAADRPVWALRYLGEVPADPIERDDWIRRAGAVAAYREERGYVHETEVIGPAPDRGSPEQRASWHAAYVALRMPEAAREVAAATDGELWARRAAYEREARWAPPYVVSELREAHLAEDTYRSDAVRVWYRADAAADETERAQAQREAQESSALAQEVDAHREDLAEVAAARRAWHAATELDRQRALMADTELRRRHPGAELPPLHPDEEARQSEHDAELIRDTPGVDHTRVDASAAPERDRMNRRDIKAAAHRESRRAGRRIRRRRPLDGADSRHPGARSRGPRASRSLQPGY